MYQLSSAILFSLLLSLLPVSVALAKPTSPPPALCEKIYAAIDLQKAPKVVKGKRLEDPPQDPRKFRGLHKSLRRIYQALDTKKHEAFELGRGGAGSVYRLVPRDGGPAFVRKVYISGKRLEEDTALLEVWRLLAEKIAAKEKSPFRVARTLGTDDARQFSDLENVEGAVLKIPRKDYAQMSQGLLPYMQSLSKKEIEGVFRKLGHKWRVTSTSTSVDMDTAYLEINIHDGSESRRLRISNWPANLLHATDGSIVVIDPR